MASEGRPQLSLRAQFDDICRSSERLAEEIREDDEIIMCLIGKLDNVSRLYSESCKQHSNLLEENAELKRKQKNLENRLEHAKELWTKGEEENDTLKKELKSIANRFIQIKEIITAHEPYLSEESKEKIVILSRSSLETVRSTLNSEKNKYFDVSPSTSKMDGDVGISFDDTVVSSSSDSELLSTAPVSRKNGVQKTTNIVSEEKKTKSESSENFPVSTVTTSQKPEERQECTESESSTLSNISSVVQDHTFVLEKKRDCSVTCIPCGKRIARNTEVHQCSACHAYCHESCREKMPCFCQPISGTAGFTISECAFPESPMVPCLISFCLKRIEENSSKNTLLYGVNPPEEDIQDLLDQFYENVSDDGVDEKKFDVSILCGAVTYCLSRLSDSLIPGNRKQDFLQLSDVGSSDGLTKCCDLIRSLKQANRDTLASLILHIHKLCGNPRKDDVYQHLIETFTPILFGPHRRSARTHYASPPWKRKAKKDELMVMKLIMTVPLDFWRNILKSDDVESYNEAVVIMGNDDAGPSDVSIPWSGTGTP